MNDQPGGSNVLQAGPATPEDFDTGVAISFAGQKAARLGNPADSTLAVIEALSEDDLNDPSYIAEMPPGLTPWRLLVGNTYKHYHEHAADIRAWLGGQG